ncbi:MAG: ACT domain-containing protein [Pseudomonadota bacterium]
MTAPPTIPDGAPADLPAPDARLSLLIELQDQPGALEAVLHVFSAQGVNLTHIESRPARGATFDFYVDCEGERGQTPIEAVIRDLERTTVKLLILDRKQVPWFPRQVRNLDAIANRTLDAGTDLAADHPGFHDPEYRARRAMIDALARDFRQGDSIPLVDYTATEAATWREVYLQLASLHERYACAEYRRILKDLKQHCDFGADRIPQARAVSAFLEARTGFRLRPVAGLLNSRDFLNGLAFRVFFSTQYIRHHSKPMYTPEPDICHELIGHAPMFADTAFADLSQEIGLASLGATDAEIERLARCYWYSVEFGLLREGGVLKAYGAGLLSSFGELDYACAPEGSGGHRAALEPWDPAEAAERPFPITEYQPLYFVAPSLFDAKARMRTYCEVLPRPFYARYSPTTQSIWVDRAVRRER